MDPNALIVCILVVIINHCLVQAFSQGTLHTLYVEAMKRYMYQEVEAADKECRRVSQRGRARLGLSREAKYLRADKAHQYWE